MPRPKQVKSEDKSTTTVDKKDNNNSNKSDDITALLLQQINDLRSQIDDLKGIKQNKDLSFGSSSNRRVIPLSDKLKSPVTYITIGRGYIMSAYNIEGSEIISPYGVPIVFKWRSTDVRNNHSEAIHYSTYTTHSKKECEFIENSPSFGNTVFSSIIEAKQVDPKLVSVIDSASRYVSSMSSEQLFAIANQYNLKVDVGAKVLRQQISAIKMQELMDSEKDKQMRNPALDGLKSDK